MNSTSSMKVSFATAVVFIVAWEALARFAELRSVPAVSEAVARAYDLFVHHALFADIRFTITNIAIGFAIASLLGIVVGVAAGMSRIAANTAGFLVEVFQSAPASALVPVIVVILGFGRPAMVTIVVIFAFFIIAISAASGAAGISSSLHDLGRTVGASRWLALRWIVLPGATPMIFTGLRLAIGRAVNGGILAELLITIQGLGGRMMFYGGSFDFVSLYALLFVVLGLTYALMGSIQAIGLRLTRWQ